MIRIVICDDIPEHLHYTEALVRRELSSFEPEIDCFQSAAQLQKCLAAGDYQPDVAVLDIEIGESSGIEIAKELNRLAPGCRIIFLSSHAEYVTASYEAEHIWYVLKSQADRYIGPALRRALSGSPLGETSVGIVAKSAGKSFFLPLGDILYIDREGRKTRVVCEKDAYYVSGSPASLITVKLAPFFVRCHQGYWVNLRNVKGIDKEEFLLFNGTRIPIGRTYRSEARERFFTRFSDMIQHK